MEKRDLITSSYDELWPDLSIKGIQSDEIREEKYFETEESLLAYDSISRRAEPQIAPVESLDSPTFISEPSSLLELKKVTSYEVIKLNKKKMGIFPLGRSNRRVVFKSEILEDWFTTVKCKILILVEINHKNLGDFYSTFESIKENIPNIVKQSQHRSIDSFIEFNEIGVVFILDGIESFSKILKLNENSLNQDSNISKNSIYFQNLFSLDLIKDMHGIDPLIKNRDNKFILEERMKQNKLIKDTDEIAHMFSRRIVGNDSFLINSIFCVKQQKKGKLNTHRWFLEGFCPMIDPKYVALLEVGIIPAPTALHLLFDAMERDETIAGCFGEVIPITKKSLNPIVYAQFFEYKFKHIFDKGFHSSNGFLFNDLPGGLNAYRWDILKEPKTRNSYFISERLGSVEDIYGEDVFFYRRTMLHKDIVCEQNTKNLLRYIEGSKAKISVPDTLNKLILQRRSWAIASLLIDFKSLYLLEHSIEQKLLFLNTSLNIFFSEFVKFFIVSSFFIGYFFSLNLNLIDKKESENNQDNYSNVQIYKCILILSNFMILSYFVKPKRAEFLYIFFCIIFSLFALITVSRILIYLCSTNFDFPYNSIELFGLIIIIPHIIYPCVLSLCCGSCFFSFTFMLSFLFFLFNVIDLDLLYIIIP